MPEAERAAEIEIYMPTAGQAQQAARRDAGSYPEVVTEPCAVRVPGQTIFFVFFFFWRCGGMMLLGMALYKYGFLDGSRADRATHDGGDLAFQ